MTGTLKGYDQLMNLVLDDVKELLRGMVVLPCHMYSHLLAFSELTHVSQMTKATNPLAR